MITRSADAGILAGVTRAVLTEALAALQIKLEERPFTPAEAYEAALVRYLEVEEDPEQFHDLTPVRVVEEAPGRSALFYAYYGPDREPVSLRWYFEFEMPRIHLDWGWRDFGLKPTPLSVDRRGRK